MIFGDRYASPDMPDHVVKEALPYIDAIGIHAWMDRFDRKYFNELYKKYNRPIYLADQPPGIADDNYSRIEQPDKQELK